MYGFLSLISCWNIASKKGFSGDKDSTVEFLPYNFLHLKADILQFRTRTLTVSNFYVNNFIGYLKIDFVELILIWSRDK